MSLFGKVRSSVQQQRHARAAAQVSPLSFLFDRQLNAVRDPAKFKALLVGRRGGKTRAAIYDFAAGMLAWPELNLYVALTISSAREIFWEPFRRLNDKHGWGFVLDESKMIIKHRNGSRLLVRGAEDWRELEKLRGPAFNRVRIDECGAHRPSYLKYMIEDVLEPTLMDCDGDVWLMGTCTTQAFGYFYDITTGALPGYSVHCWTAEVNPHVEYHRFVFDPVAGVLARRNWTVDHPTFRREYLAEWTVDSDRLVFRFGRDRNVVLLLPQLAANDNWERIVSLDFGVNNLTACSVLAYPKRYGKDCYVEHTWAQHGLAPSQAADLIRSTVEQYRPVLTVGDSGGIGKAYIQEMALRYPGVPIRAAVKPQKRARLEFMSDAMFTAVKDGDHTQRRGLLSLSCNEDLHRELATLQWDEQREDIAEGQQDDRAMAVLYGFAATPAFANQTAFPAPEPDVRGTTLQWAPKPRYVVPENLRAFARGWSKRR